MTDNTEIMDDVVKKQAENRQKIALFAMSIGSILGLIGYWMYANGGGTLMHQPEPKLYLVPTVAGLILFAWGFHSL